MINYKKVIILTIILSSFALGFYRLKSDENSSPDEAQHAQRKAVKTLISNKENLKTEKESSDSNRFPTSKERYEILSALDERGGITIDEDLNGEGELHAYNAEDDTFITYRLVITEGEVESFLNGKIEERGMIRKISEVQGIKLEGIQLELNMATRFFVPEGHVNLTIESVVNQEIQKNEDREAHRREMDEANLMNSESGPEEGFYPDQDEHEI